MEKSQTRVMVRIDSPKMAGVIVSSFPFFISFRTRVVSFSKASMLSEDVGNTRSFFKAVPFALELCMKSSTLQPLLSLFCLNIFRLRQPVDTTGELKGEFEDNDNRITVLNEYVFRKKQALVCLIVLNELHRMTR